MSNSMRERKNRLNVLLNFIKGFDEGTEKKTLCGFMSINQGITAKITLEYLKDLENAGLIHIDGELVQYTAVMDKVKP